jgi:hypothetical protein
LVAFDVAEAEGVQASTAANDDIFHRALQAMMNGELAARDAAQEVWTLEKPDWMLASSQGWSEEEKRLAGEFAVEQKRLDNEREMRRSCLEAEVTLSLPCIHHVFLFCLSLFFL